MNPFSEIIDCLKGSDVEFVVVEGFATVLHGVNRLTHDLDIVLRLVPDNVTRAIEAI